MPYKEEIVGLNVKRITIRMKGKATKEQLDTLPKINVKKYCKELESKGYIIHFA